MFVGLLPPPIDGQRWATARMRALLEPAFELRVLNIGPRDRTHLTGRLLRIARTMVSLLLARLGGCRRLYLAPYSGCGLWLAAVLLLWARGLGYRTAVHLHSYLAVDSYRLEMAAFSHAGGNQVLYVCLGIRMAAALSRRYAAVKRTCVLGNALMVPVPATAAPRRRRTSPDKPIRLGHLGNLSYAKGLDTVLLTARVLADAKEPFVLDLAGTADDAVLPAITAAVAADPDRVRWLGPLYGRAKDDWFDSLDVFLLPTRHAHEASPLVLFEAMRAGVVPVATSRGCIAEDLGDAGILVSDPQPQAFARATLAVLQGYSKGADDLDAASARALQRYALLWKAAEHGLAGLIDAIGEANGVAGPRLGPPPARLTY